jgi:CheY-like chemotaxis protein
MACEQKNPGFAQQTAAETKGLSFYLIFELPLTACRDWLRCTVPRPDCEIGLRQETRDSMPAMTGSRKIIVVDDEETIADTLALIFSSNGYEARTAYSAEQALETLEEWKPDLAIIDVVLPGMNGIEFAIFLKASYPDVHFLLFSGQPGTGGLLDEAKKKGHLFEILAKPLHPTFMLATVANMLSAPPADMSHLPN